MGHRKFYSILCLMVVSVASPTFAQWERDGKIIIPTNPSSSWSACSDDSGGAIITWDNYIDGSWEIFIQRVDSAGFFQWGDSGLQLTDVEEAQSFPIVISDGLGGAFVAWVDFRNQSGGGASLYAQFVDTDGNILWTDNGVLLISPNSDNWITDLIRDGYGGLIATCSDSRSGNNDLYAQRINSLGEVLWDSAGVPLCIFSEDQSDTRLIRGDLNSFFAVWNDYRDFDQTGADIYSQKFDINGTCYWGESGSLVANSEFSDGFQGAFDAVQDNDGGLVIVWHIYNYPEEGMLANRLSASGESVWNTNGIQVFLVDVTIDDNPKIMNCSGDYVIPHGINSIEQTRGYKINESGEHIWPPDGVVLLPDISVRT